MQAYDEIPEKRGELHFTICHCLQNNIFSVLQLKASLTGLMHGQGFNVPNNSVGGHIFSNDNKWAGVYCT